ncbi:hypothetical protein ACFLZ7_02405 [Nanoarchaeota archaeon]
MGKIINILVIGFAILLLTVMFLNLLSTNKSLTGYTSLQFNTEVVNIELTSNSIEELDFIDNQISSISVKGSVEGGSAHAYIEDSDGKRYLIYKNNQERAGLITGLFVQSSKSEFSGCLDSCILPQRFNSPYKLVVELGPNTSLFINEIIYK